MEVLESKLSGCLILKPNVFEDERGYFFESFNQQKFEKAVGEKVIFVQDNQSFSTYGVLRGIHFQEGKHAQAKLVRVLSGKVLDIAVDLRPDSPTYGDYESVVLSAENKKQFFVPRGFGHGFVVLSETASFFYKCDNFYNKDSEGGVIYNDPDLQIDWGVPQQLLKVSEKDMKLDYFNKILEK